MDILDDMWVSKLSAKVFSKVNYSFKWTKWLQFLFHDKFKDQSGLLLRFLAQTCVKCQ